MNTTSRFVASLALGLILLTCAAHANQFSSRLTGLQETSRLTVSGLGTATYSLTEAGLTYHITVDGLSGPVTAAYFYDGAPGTDGVRVKTIAFVNNTASGIWTPTDAEPLADTIKTDLLLGNVYVNVLTSDNPAGEIRSAVNVSSGSALTTRMNSDQVFHHGGNHSTGGGTGSFSLVEEGLAYKITVDGVTAPIEGEFGLGVAGQQGPVLKTVIFRGNTAQGVWHYDDPQPLTDEIRGEILSGHVYFEIGTGGYYGNEMRGQLYPAEGWGYHSACDASQENHSVTSNGHASAAFVLTDAGLAYNIEVSGLTGPILAAHLHHGAAGADGPVVWPLTFVGNKASGLWRKDDATTPLTPDLLTALRNGDLYVNVHTAAYGAGEIRGQVMPSAGAPTGSAEFSADQESSIINSTATGIGVFNLTAAGLEYHITVDGLTGPISSAAFHHREPGRDGSVVHDITFNGNTADGVWSTTGSQPFTGSRLQDFLMGNLYVNIETPNYQNGEIRGQVILESGAALATVLAAPVQSQQIAGLPGMGTAAITVTPAGLWYTVTVHDLSGPVQAAHFHQIDSTPDGPILLDITSSFNGNTAIGTWTPTDAVPLTPAVITALMNGQVYLNVHTLSYPNGEIRGDFLVNAGEGFGAGMDRSQETQAVTSNGTGTGAVTVTGMGAPYMVTITNLTGPVVAAHFHDGPLGINGPVVRAIELTGLTSTSGLWMTTDTQPLTDGLIQEIEAGNLYFNVHTAAYPAGEIRGQLSPLQSPQAVGPGVGGGIVPAKYALAQNFPNPFNPTTEIQFDLPQTVHAKLMVFNDLGQVVATLVDGQMPAGQHQVNFSADQLPSGMYFYRLQAGNVNLVKRMVLLK